MSKKFTKTMPLLFLAVTLALAGGCSNTANPSGTPTPGGTLTSAPVLTETGTPEPTKDEPTAPSPTLIEDPTSSEVPTPAESDSMLTPAEPIPTTDPLLTPTETDTNPTPTEGTAEDFSDYSPLAGNTACMYMNYSNAFPLIYTKNCEVRFSQDDTVTITTGTDIATLNLSNVVSFEGEDFSDPEAWYFCGAFQSDDIVYAHYDYLDGRASSPSLLLQIDPLACTATCCIRSQNPRKTFSDSFTIAGETLYYTYTDYSSDGTATSCIFRTDRNGEQLATCVACAQGETIPYMISDGKCLYFVMTDTKAVKRLICFDPATGDQNVICPRLSTVDFLAALDGFLLTSAQNNTLRYYSQEGTAFTLKLTTDTSLSAGTPMTDGNYIYIPLLDYSAHAATKVATVNLAKNQVVEERTLDDKFYYCAGIINQYLYAENVDNFITFILEDISYIEDELYQED